MKTTKKPALAALVRVLDSTKVSYAIIGGVAVQVHHPDPRTTLDIDVAVLSVDAIPRDALTAAGFQSTGSFEHSENWVAENGTPVQFTDDPGLASAVRSAEEIPLEDVTLRVTARLHRYHPHRSSRATAGNFCLCLSYLKTMRKRCVMKFALLVLGLSAFSLSAATTVIEINLATPTADPVANYVATGERYRVTLLNAIPGAEYTISPIGVIVKSGAAPEKGTDACEFPDRLLARKLDGVTKEADVAKMIDEVKAENGKCAADKRKVFEHAFTTATTADLIFDSKTTTPLTVKRGQATWAIVIEPRQKKSDLEAAAKLREEGKHVSELIDRTNDPDLVVRRCEWDKQGDCESGSIFVNADQTSTLIVSKIPNTVRLVTVTAHERFACAALEHNYASFTNPTDTIVVPLSMRAPLLSPFSNAKRENYGLSLYGIVRPTTIEQGGRKIAVVERNIPDDARDAVCTAAALTPIAEATLPLAERSTRTLEAFERQALFTRLSGIDYPSIPLLVRGKSRTLTVQFMTETGEVVRTFNVPISYQRFWLDAGGFFAFARREDEDLVKQALTGDDKDKVSVTAIRRLKDLNPSTGIVVNVHPGNYPYLAWQFGIAAQQDRLPSYYLGMGLRAREIGRRGLATVAVGVAAVQSNRFTGLTFTDKCGANKDIPCRILPSDSILLTPQRKYALEPYLSISLGFSFGGVSDRGDVTKTVIK